MALKRTGRRAVVTAILVAAVASAGCGGGVAIGSLPIRNDFTECDGFSMNDEIATVDCPDSRLRILVSKPALSPVHFVPFRFDGAAEGLAVEAAVRSTHGSSAHGLGCDTTGPGMPSRGYLFVIGSGTRELDGVASIVKLDAAEGEAEDGRFSQTLETLGFKRGAVTGDGAHQVRAVCKQAADGSVRLTMFVDGREVVRAHDKGGIGPFSAALAVMIAAVPDSEVVLDDLHVESAS